VQKERIISISIFGKKERIARLPILNFKRKEKGLYNRFFVKAKRIFQFLRGGEDRVTVLYLDRSNNIIHQGMQKICCWIPHSLNLISHFCKIVMTFTL
jgi:hypothetical protein